MTLVLRKSEYLAEQMLKIYDGENTIIKPYPPAPEISRTMLYLFKINNELEFPMIYDFLDIEKGRFALYSYDKIILEWTNTTFTNTLSVDKDQNIEIDCNDRSNGNGAVKNTTFTPLKNSILVRTHTKATNWAETSEYELSCSDEGYEYLNRIFKTVIETHKGWMDQ